MNLSTAIATDLPASADQAARWRLQGDAALRAVRLDEAVRCFREALNLHPDDTDTLRRLGVAYNRQGRFAAAVDVYRRALAVRPDDAAALCNLGNALQATGRLAEAEATLQRAVTLAPALVEAANNLGNVLRMQGRLDAAEACFQSALQHRPGDAAVLSNLGNLYMDRQEPQRAEGCYRRALAAQPQDLHALGNLAQSLRLQGRCGEAATVLETVLDQAPRQAVAWNALGLVRQDQGRIPEALEAFHRVTALDAGDPQALSNLIFAMHYAEGQPSGAHADAAHRWWQRFGPARLPSDATFQNPPDPFRRLRVGFVSGDFRRHSVAFFLQPLFAHLDPGRMALFAYSQVRRPDDMTAHLAGRCHRFQSIVGWPAERVVERIRAEGIDILIDLAGHSADNRLDVFALRPAPVLVTWLGYPGTTGLPVIDYRLTDAWADPPGAVDAGDSERLLRLPYGFLCYAPPPEAPAVRPRTPGPVVFGSFNTLPKIGPAVIDAWADVLRQVPDSELLIKCAQLSDPDTRHRLLEGFAARGIVSRRIRLMPRAATTAAHLAMYQEVDIALDPFPYNGTTTTCEALWMGVPVVTLRGDRHSARVGSSILNQLQLTELIAADRDDYVRRAVCLAQQPQRLAALRTGLRQRLAASPLCDGPAFARAFQAAVSKMWMVWCARQGTAVGHGGHACGPVGEY